VVARFASHQDAIDTYIHINPRYIHLPHTRLIAPTIGVYLDETPRFELLRDLGADIEIE